MTDAPDDEPSPDWIEGFEVGCSVAQDRALRMEAVKQAANVIGPGESFMDLAREIYRFVIGETCAVCGGPLHDDEPGTMQ